MKSLVKAVLSVMAEVKNIEKNMVVGSGNNQYNGVSDKDVKSKVGDAMRKNGLVLFPISIVPKVDVSRWEESGQYGSKQKQSVFTHVETKYILAHESGESVELSGYGHGVDTQDKGAGKATTYALKYLLLYIFLIPTGSIDDADKDHSDKADTPPPPPPTAIPPPDPYTLPTNDADAITLLIEKATYREQLSTFGHINAAFFKSNPEMGEQIKNKINQLPKKSS